MTVTFPFLKRGQKVKPFIGLILIALLLGCAGNTPSRGTQTETVFSSKAPMKALDYCLQNESGEKGFQAFASILVSLRSQDWVIEEVTQNNGIVKAAHCRDEVCHSLLFHPFQNGMLTIYPPDGSEYLFPSNAAVDDLSAVFEAHCSYSSNQLKSKIGKLGFVFFDDQGHTHEIVTASVNETAPAE